MVKSFFYVPIRKPGEILTYLTPNYLHIVKDGFISVQYDRISCQPKNASGRLCVLQKIISLSSIIVTHLLASQDKFVPIWWRKILVVAFRFGLTGLFGNAINQFLKEYFILCNLI